MFIMLLPPRLVTLRSCHPPLPPSPPLGVPFVIISVLYHCVPRVINIPHNPIQTHNNIRLHF